MYSMNLVDKRNVKKFCLYNLDLVLPIFFTFFNDNVMLFLSDIIFTKYNYVRQKSTLQIYQGPRIYTVKDFGTLQPQGT